jgi:lysophospholipase L1-like esterase
VTYTHKDHWTGPLPQTQSLPHLGAALKKGGPITIAAYGMSITRGMDVSAYHDQPPYTPNYIDLFTEELARRHVTSRVTCYNAGLPGAAVDWGAQQARQYIAPLNPDLVLIDFGMNDFWRIPPREFSDSVRSIIRTIRASNPAVEFLLIANMQFDPAYNLDSDRNKPFYTGNMQGYRDSLLAMRGPGIICLDMTSLSAAIYRRKKAKDCIVNPLHPNDYLGRWYAQALLKTLDELSLQSAPQIP